MKLNKEAHVNEDTYSIAYQSIYYDNRWANNEYLNPFAFQRLIVILKMIKWLGLKNPAILDLGCGTGWLTNILNELGPSTGIELSDKTIESAKNRYPTVEFIAGNLFEIDILERSYNIVVSQEVIEHVEDQIEYINVAAKSLKSNGYLVLTTPNARNFNHWSEDELKRWNLQPIEEWLTSRQLVKLLKHEFHILKIKTIIPKFGSNGIYRLLSSVKVNKILSMLKIQYIKDEIALGLGLGLHIAVLARKKKHKINN